MSGTVPGLILDWGQDMKTTFFFATFIASIGAAYATTITIVPATGIANAVADENAWITANFPSGDTASLVETFETYGYGPYNQLATGAGTFVAVPGGLGSNASGTGTDQFTILNSSDTPFNGRYNTTPGGNNWLDSNDITDLQLNTSLSNVYFFITDVNDTGGVLTMKTQDGTTSSSFATPGYNGEIYFVGISSSGPIGNIQWLNTSQGDGYGLDDFGTVKSSSVTSTPEPANWLMASSGLLILLGAVRLRMRAAGSSR